MDNFVFIRGSINGLINRAAENPVLIFSILYFIFNLSFFSFFFFIIVIIFSLFSYFISQLWNDNKSTLEALRFVSKYRNSAFSKMPIEDVISLYDKTDEVVACILPEGRNKTIGLFCTLEENNKERCRNNTLNVFSTTTAFQRCLLDSLIISPKKSISSGSCADADRFIFFHELGHLSHGHTRIKTMLFDSVWQSIFFLFILSISSGDNNFSLLFVFISITAWMYNYISLYLFAEKRKIFESVADGFAICRFREQQIFSSIEKMFKDRREERQRRSFEWFKEWALDPVDTSDYPLIGHFLSKTRWFSSRTINFKSAVEKFSTPNLYVNVCLLMSIIISASYSAIDRKDIYIYLFVLIIIPLLFFTKLYISLYMRDYFLSKRLNGEYGEGRWDLEIDKIVDEMP